MHLDNQILTRIIWLLAFLFEQWDTRSSRISISSINNIVMASSISVFIADDLEHGFCPPSWSLFNSSSSPSSATVLHYSIQHRWSWVASSTTSYFYIVCVWITNSQSTHTIIVTQEFASRTAYLAFSSQFTSAYVSLYLIHLKIFIICANRPVICTSTRRSSFVAKTVLLRHETAVGMRK